MVNMHTTSVAILASCIAVVITSHMSASADNLGASTATKNSAEVTDIIPPLNELISAPSDRLAAEIKRAKRKQPDWDTAPIEAEANKAINLANSSNDFDYTAFRNVVLLSFKTPLLDFELVKSANEWFEAGAKWCDRQYILVRSGNDQTMFLPSLSEAFTRLKEDLARSEINHPSTRISRIRKLFERSNIAFESGDTRKADAYGWQILKLAEDSNDYKTTANILKWYDFFLAMMRYRSDPEHYKTESNYVSREAACIQSDSDFVATLNHLQQKRDTNKEFDTLRRLFTEIVRCRRAGENDGIQDSYSKLVNLAKNSEDFNFALRYSALKACHTYLQTVHSEPKDYVALRTELYDAWALEEINRQPSLIEANKTANDDRKRLESVLEAMEQQCILVSRDIELCDLWGGSTPLMLLRVEHHPAYRGLIYYQYPGKYRDLYLECRALSHLKNCGEPSTESKRLTEKVRKALILVGFKPTSGQRADTLRVTGDWGLPYRN